MTSMIRRKNVPYVTPWDLLDHEFQNLFDGFLRQEEQTAAMDFYRQGDSFVAEIELPGFEPKDVDLRVYRDHFDVTAKRQSCQESNDRQHFVKERTATSFSRSVRFPEPVDPDRVTASFQSGLLKIAAPVAAAQQARVISLCSPEEQKTEPKA